MNTPNSGTLWRIAETKKQNGIWGPYVLNTMPRRTHTAFVQQWVACATANATYAGMVTASRKLVAGAVDDGNTGATGRGMEWAGQYEEHVNHREEHGAGPLVGPPRPICP